MATPKAVFSELAGPSAPDWNWKTNGTNPDTTICYLEYTFNIFVEAKQMPPLIFLNVVRCINAMMNHVPAVLFFLLYMPNSRVGFSNLAMLSGTPDKQTLMVRENRQLSGISLQYFFFSLSSVSLLADNGFHLGPGSFPLGCLNICPLKTRLW